MVQLLASELRKKMNLLLTFAKLLYQWLALRLVLIVIAPSSGTSYQTILFVLVFGMVDPSCVKLCGRILSLFSQPSGTTACNGDSGGSLTFEENGVYRIRGIVSLTQASQRNNRLLCKVDQYVVFTDVAKYLDWIQYIQNGARGNFNVDNFPEVIFVQ